jgi:preprotein translocase SecE subunit
MARETRRQRRDARRAAGDDAAAARARRQQSRPVVQEAAVEAVQREPRGKLRFVRESWAELQKVDWPNRSQVIQGTVVVLIACAVVGAFLWGADQALRPFVREVLLGK